LPFLGAEDHRMDVAAWLRGLGLEQYAPTFSDNDVDGEVLSELTADDLISIGVTSVGHRRKLLATIAALGREPSTRDVAQSATSATSAPASPPPIEAERRQLTVMFCDVVDSTALAELGFLLLGNAQRFAIKFLGGLRMPPLQQQLAFVPGQLRSEPALSRPLHDLQGIVQQGQSLVDLPCDLTCCR
jgi:hypothetical protein